MTPIPEEIKKKIDEHLQPLVGYIGNITLSAKREDIEFGYILAQSEIERLKEIIKKNEAYSVKYDNYLSLTLDGVKPEKAYKDIFGYE